MEFTVSRADLVRELNLSQGVVEKKTTIPILSNVLVEADGDKIVLTATDLELGIRCSCAARVKKSGAGTIPARRLLDYVRLLPDSDVQVKVGDNHCANLVCGRSKTRIAGMSRESFPELPEMPETLAEIPISVLNAMITKTVFAIYTKRRVVGSTQRRLGHGGDGWSPPCHGGEQRRTFRGHRSLPGAAAAQ